MSDKCHCGESRRKTFTIKELKMEISELKKKIKDDDWRWEQYFEQKKTIDELKKQLEEGVCNHINAPYRTVLAERDELKKRVEELAKDNSSLEDSHFTACASISKLESLCKELAEALELFIKRIPFNDKLSIQAKQSLEKYREVINGTKSD